MIRLGINMPNFGPQTDAWALLSWTRFAESNGFAAIVLSDHVAPTSEVTDVYPPPFYDPLTAIAWLAGQSQDLLFATSVLVVRYRHPLLTARVSAMIITRSPGRTSGCATFWPDREGPHRARRSRAPSGWHCGQTTVVSAGSSAGRNRRAVRVVPPSVRSKVTIPNGRWCSARPHRHGRGGFTARPGGSGARSASGACPRDLATRRGAR